MYVPNATRMESSFAVRYVRVAIIHNAARTYRRIQRRVIGFAMIVIRKTRMIQSVMNILLFIFTLQ